MGAEQLRPASIARAAGGVGRRGAARMPGLPALRLRLLLAEADRVDRATYRAVALTPTPLLDGAMRRVSRAADYSRLSIASSAVLAAVGGPAGRRAAAGGLASVAATALFVNVVVKPLGRRHRPTRDMQRVVLARRVRMPRSRSFPSGHTAAAVAFATGAGRSLPAASLPLHALAALVSYSRVHTGVHYPGDVVAGALLGAVIADCVTGGLAHACDARARSPVSGAATPASAADA